MSETATAAQPTTSASIRQIRPVSIFAIPVDRDTLFSNHKGVYKKKIEKRQRRLIVKSTLIKSFLHAGEYVRCITTAYSPVSDIEKDLAGPAFLYFKRALLVFTDKRILHIPTRFDRSPRGTVSQINFRNCAAIEIKGKSLEIRYKNGQQEVFGRIAGRERKKLGILFSEISLSPEKEGSPQGRVCLCPRCTQILAPGANRCAVCDLVFKNNLKAGLWTFLVPGGGLFYLRYPLAGSAVALFEIFLIAFIGVYVFETSRAASPDYGLAALPAAGLLVWKMINFFLAKQMVKECVAEN